MVNSQYTEARNYWTSLGHEHVAVWWGNKRWAVEASKGPRQPSDLIIANLEELSGLTVDSIVPWQDLMDQLDNEVVANSIFPRPTATACIPTLKIRFELWVSTTPSFFICRRTINAEPVWYDTFLETPILDLADWYVSHGIAIEDTHLGGVPRWQARIHTWLAKTRFVRWLARKTPLSEEWFFWGGSMG